MEKRSANVPACQATMKRKIHFVNFSLQIKIPSQKPTFFYANKSQLLINSYAIGRPPGPVQKK